VSVVRRSAAQGAARPHTHARRTWSRRTEGFAKSLEIQGVGYKAEPKPFGVQLVFGFSHPVPYNAPKGIKNHGDETT